MPRRKSKRGSVERLERELQALDRDVPEDLRLSSLAQDPPQLYGYAFRFTLVIPLMASTGEEVFTSMHLPPLHGILVRRFGGFSAMSSTSHPPLYGYYQPREVDFPEKDYHTQLVVYSAPLDAANFFFARLEAILRNAPLVPQDEVLIERLDAMLI